MKTEKLFYKDPYMREFDADVISCTPGDNGRFLTELSRTAFYPEGGGQPADTGTITSGDTLVHVSDVQELFDGTILHYCSGPLGMGSAVHGILDWERRFDHMQQHSGEHIVSGMICRAFNCDNVGFHLGSDVVTIDFNTAIAPAELKSIEEKANSYIWEDHGFVELWPSQEELLTMHYRSKKELSGEVRITSFPGADCCACCGTHLKRSSEVGIVKFISCNKFTKGTRIELLCGKRAYEFLSMNFEQNSDIAKGMAAGLDKTAAVYHKQKDELIEEKLRYGALEKRYFEHIASGYKDAGDVLIFEDGLEPDSLRKLCVLIGNICCGRCLAFSAEQTGSMGYKYSCVHKGHDISAFIKEMNKRLNGRGGGRSGFAQGFVKASKEEIISFCKAGEDL